MDILSIELDRSRWFDLKTKNQYSLTQGNLILLFFLNQDCFSLQLEKCYSIRDVCEDKVVLRGVQDFHPFHFDGLKNVIIRDAENLPVARVCFKQKSLLYSSMVNMPALMHEHEL